MALYLVCLGSGVKGILCYLLFVTCGGVGTAYFVRGSWCFLILGGVGEPAHEEDGAGGFVADEEEEGVVGAEDGGRGGGEGGGGDHRDCGGGGGFGAEFVDVDVGFVDDFADLEGGGGGDVGEVGVFGEGEEHTHFVQGV